MDYFKHSCIKDLPDTKLSDFNKHSIQIMIIAMNEFRNNNLGSMLTDMDNLVEINTQLQQALYKKQIEEREMQN